VLTEIPWDENPVSHSNAGDVPPPATPGISRRGVLAASGIGVGIVVATSIGQTVTPLEPIGLLAVRRWRQGPQGVPVNRTAEEAGITTTATAADWVLQVDGPRPYVITLDDLARASLVEDRLPINCVEGWSVGATWRGLSLLELVIRAGGGPDSSVRVASLERAGLFNVSVISGPQLGRALLATHLNGERLDLDHGYPIRLIAPNRAGVLNTKWLARVEVLS
jgi:DMSO/TMAO reductase YedYZ molybdopterin-dependent catalytic subunit